MSAWGRFRTFLRHDLWRQDLAELGLLARARIRLLRLLVVAGWEFQENVLTLRAMGLVYTTLLSLVPFLAVTFSVLKAFGAHYQVEPFLLRALEPLGQEGVEITQRMIEFVNNLKVGVLGAVGVAALFYTVISLLDKVEEALNYIWRVRRPRSLGRKFSDYLSVVLVGPVLIVAALALTASAQSHWLVQRVLAMEPFGPVLVVVAARVMPFLFLTAAFTFLYKFIPYTKVQFQSALVGGATAAVLWQLGGIAFASFVAASPRYAAIYSGFAILILFLIWLYVAWLIILVGAEIAYFHQHPAAYLTRVLQRSGTQVVRERLALGALTLLARRYLAGEPPWPPQELAAAVDAPPSVVEDLLEEFLRRGVVFRVAEPEGVALGRPPEQVTVVDVLETVRDPADLGPGALGEPVGAAREVLRHRDEAVRAALSGLTLRTLALDEAGNAAASASADAGR